MNTENLFIFKTSVKTEQDKREIEPVLNGTDTIRQWNIDLEDCDSVLRVVAPSLDAIHIIDLLNQKGYLCIELD